MDCPIEVTHYNFSVSGVNLYAYEIKCEVLHCIRVFSNTDDKLKSLSIDIDYITPYYSKAFKPYYSRAFNPLVYHQWARNNITNTIVEQYKSNYGLFSKISNRGVYLCI